MCIFHYFNYYLPDFVAAICLGFIFGFSLLDICFNLTKCHNKPLVESSFLTRDQDLSILWDAAKAVLRGNFIAIQSYFKKQEKHQLDNLTLYLKQLEKGEQKNSKISRKKEIIKIQGEINEIAMKETIVKINKTKVWFFETTKKKKQTKL